MPFLAVLRTGALGLAALAAAGSAVSQSQTSAQAGAQAGQRKADLELVLAVDISRSMDYEEHELQRDGYVEAFRHKDVVNALMSGPEGRIAVTYMEWAAEGSTYQVIPWTMIDSTAAAHAFADRLAEEQIRSDRRTSISAALFAATDLIEGNDIVAHRRVIDVSGDGANNAGLPVEEARDFVLRRDITINGLPILLNKPGSGFGNGYEIEHLDRYYKHCVIGGDGAFIAPVYDLKHLAATIRKKLVMEIAGLDVEPDAAPIQFAEAPPANEPGVVRVQLKLPTEKSDCLAGEKARMRRDGFNFR